MKITRRYINGRKIIKNNGNKRPNFFKWASIRLTSYFSIEITKIRKQWNEFFIALKEITKNPDSGKMLLKKEDKIIFRQLW